MCAKGEGDLLMDATRLVSLLVVTTVVCGVLDTYMNRANIEMKLIFTWLLMNVKLSSCTDDADGQAPNTIMAYTEANRTK